MPIVHLSENNSLAKQLAPRSLIDNTSLRFNFVPSPFLSLLCLSTPSSSPQIYSRHSPLLCCAIHPNSTA